MSGIQSFLEELKRRRVYRTGLAYLAGAFVLWQAAEILVPALGLPDVVLRAVVLASLAGFPVALVLSWLFDIVPASEAAAAEAPEGVRTVPRSRAIAIGITAGLVTVFGLVFWVGWTGSEATPETGNATAVVAVVPFETRGGEEVDVLSEGIVDLLYMGLDGAAGIRVVEPRRSIGAWIRVTDRDAPDEVVSSAVAEATGSAIAISGRVVRVGEEVRVTANVWDAEGGRVASHQVDGTADAVLSMVDRLSLLVLQALLPDGQELQVDVGALASTSPHAVGSYLNGMRAFREGRFRDASAAFEEAVAADSTFALAYLGLAGAYGWSGLHGSAEQSEALGSAARHADRLPVREARLVGAYALNNELDPAAVDSMRAFVRDYPDDVRGWYALGDFQYHSAGVHSLAYEEVLAPFDRALELDPAYRPALLHPLERSLIEGDRERFRGYLEPYERGQGDTRGFRVAHDAVFGEGAEADAALDRALERGAHLDGILAAILAQRPQSIDRMLDGLRDSPVLNESHTGAFVRGYLGLATGRLEVTEDAVRTLTEAGEGGAGFARLIELVGALAGITDVAEARRALDAMSVSDERGSAGLMGAMLDLRAGDPAAAREKLRLVRESMADDDDAGQIRAGGVEGWARLLEGDRQGGIDLLRQTVAELPRPTLASGQIENVFRLELALALAAEEGTRAEAIELLETGFTLWAAPGMYLVARIALAEALEAAERLDEARATYTHVVALLEGADEAVAPRREAAQAAVERLEAGR